MVNIKLEVPIFKAPKMKAEMQENADITLVISKEGMVVVLITNRATDHIRQFRCMFALVIVTERNTTDF
jgi:hypothetical protein